MSNDDDITTPRFETRDEALEAMLRNARGIMSIEWADAVLRPFGFTLNTPAFAGLVERDFQVTNSPVLLEKGAGITHIDDGAVSTFVLVERLMTTMHAHVFWNKERTAHIMGRGMEAQLRTEAAVGAIVAHLFVENATKKRAAERRPLPVVKGGE